jgi:protein TonB
MDRRRVHSGLFGSIGLHLVIMLIPLTTTVVREFDEIELLVVNEKPVNKEQISERPKIITVSKTVEQEVKKKPIISPMPPATEEQKPVNQTVIEPQKELIEEPPEEIPATMESPVVVETPSTLPEQISEDPPKSQSTQLPQTIMPVVQNKGTETTQSTQVQSATHNGSAGSQTSSLTQPLSSSDDVPFGSEVAPRFLRREIPIYPLMARRLGKEAKVLLRLSIDEKGNLFRVDVIEKGGYGFTEAAVEAVRKSTFLPAKKDGKPIASRALLPIRFQLERKGW